jgi:MFS family permease
VFNLPPKHLTRYLFSFANANVLLVLGELIEAEEDNDDGSPKRSAIPLIAGAIILAQLTMAIATSATGRLTNVGYGRKPLFLVGLASLPIRCGLIVVLQDAGVGWLLATQFLDGLAGGICGLVHPYLVADLTFGTGRFNVVMGMTASCFRLGATLSNFLGQMLVEKYGHETSLVGSLILSIFPVIIFGMCMPETRGMRGISTMKQRVEPEVNPYVEVMLSSQINYARHVNECIERHQI